VNNGILEATNGGRLLLQAAVTGNSGSEIRAAAGSTVEQAGVTVSGIVNTTGGGLFTANSSSANFLSAVTLNGTLDMASIGASRERIVNGLTLNGSINLGGSVILSIDNASHAAAQTLSGAGTVNLDGPGARLAFEGGFSTAIESGIVIRGEGGIGQANYSVANQQVTVNGRISADVSGGTLALTLPASGGNSSYVNNGVFEAINGGRLLLQAAVIGNTGSQLRAGAGSVIEQSGVTVSGTINTTGSGLFTASSSSANSTPPPRRRSRTTSRSPR
jgi:hypothetical protein